MCTNPKRIFNRAKYHQPGLMKVQMDVPCGCCAECMEAKQLEWNIRSNAEYEYCRSRGGYTYFETLTYNQDCLPFFDGKQCFNKKDVQDFLKRLRQSIFRATGLKSPFKYFYVSEYGHQYKRPHYHILFFVDDPSLKYYDLHRFVHECWWYGNTDLRNMVFPSNGIVKTEDCCRYVSKYVTKPDEYVVKLIDCLSKQYDLKTVRDHFKPFHHQSTGFGSCLFEDVHQLKHIMHMQCVFRDRLCPLPMYYIRKQFYQLETFPDGSQSWKLNDLGCYFVIQKKYHMYEDYTEKLHNFLAALPQYLTINHVFKSVQTYLNGLKDVDYTGETIKYDSVSDILSFVSQFSDKFVSDFAFSHYFESGFVKDTGNCSIFNNLVYANEKNYVKLDLYSQEGRETRPMLSSMCDAKLSLKYKRFDALYKVIRAAIGSLDTSFYRKKEKMNRLYKHYTYACN